MRRVPVSAATHLSGRRRATTPLKTFDLKPFTRAFTRMVRKLAQMNRRHQDIAFIRAEAARHKRELRAELTARYDELYAELGLERPAGR